MKEDGLTTRQHSFYMEDDDWVRLRHHCLDQGISVSSFLAQTALSAISATTYAGIGGTFTSSHMEGATRVIDDFDLKEVSVSFPKVITSASDVPAFINHAIHPVPKPSSRPKRSRRP